MEFDVDALLEYSINENEEVIKNKEREDIKMAKSLKEMILEKLNYRKIAEMVYDELEDEISSEVAASIDDYDIVNYIKNNNKDNYVELAKGVVVDEILEDIEDISSDIEDEFKEVVREKVNY